MLVCRKCNKSYQATAEFFYVSNGKLMQPCKSCRREYQAKYISDNAYNHSYYTRNKDRIKAKQKRYYNVNKGYYAKYQKEYQSTEDGRNKFRTYNKKRLSKRHRISKMQWEECRKYFNYSCAYCGLSEDKHRLVYGHGLHKEHVIHDGRNDIKNCVPSCKGCNSKKDRMSLNNWYNEGNPIYDKRRYLAIYNWLRYDCKNV